MDEIIQKIDKFLGTHENSITKTEVLRVVDYLIEDVEDDKVYLEAFRNTVEAYWSTTNIKLVENFNRILSLYGILSENVDRKATLEVKGKHIVKRFIEVKHAKEIKDILGI